MANIELDGANKKITVDSGDLTLDVPGDIILDADGADLVFADGGTNLLKITNSSSDVVLQPQVDAKDIIFKQYDGRALLDINDGGFVGIYNGATGPGQLRLYEDTDNGTNYTAFQVGTQSGDVTYTLPTADGSNGHALTTNGSGTLSWASAGGSDPSSADGDSLGTASAEWSDLYLADGGVVYFGNDQEITLTHSADSGLLLKHTATADDKPINLVLQTGETDMAANDVIGKISWQAPDEGTGTDAILVSAAIQAVAEGNHSSSSNATRLEFHTGASELATSQMTISSGGIVGIGAGVPGDLGAGLHIKTGDSGAGSVNAYADDLVIENSIESGITILSGNTECGLIAFGDDGDNDIAGIKYCHDGNTLRLLVNASERVRFQSDGNVTIGKTSVDDTADGISLLATGEGRFTCATTHSAIFNRQDNDGVIVYLKQAASAEGNISVSGSTVSYNAFCGSHWSRLADNSKPTILRGTVMESIATMCDWYQAVADVAESTDSNGTVTPAHQVKEPINLPNGKSVGDAVTFTSNGKEYTGVYVKEDNERLSMCKISDTEDSKAVYGVFMAWDDADDGLDGDVNDMYVASLGAFVVRIHKDETVAIGDYLQSKGDGTAKKQADDILRASTIAKVTSTEKTHTHADGSYCVPCTLHCG